MFFFSYNLIVFVVLFILMRCLLGALGVFDSLFDLFALFVCLSVCLFVLTFFCGGGGEGACFRVESYPGSFCLFFSSCLALCINES